MSVLTPANQLTLVRVMLVPAFVILTVYGSFGWALIVFAIAGLTDLLDGLIARTFSRRTSLGAWLDPMADKLLIVATFIVLTLPGLGLVNKLPVWLTILIISREFAVSGLRQIAAASGHTIGASDLGKTKMTAQVVAIALVIGGIRWPALAQIGSIAMWAVVAFTVISAFDYFRRFWHEVDAQVKTRRRKELLHLERQPNAAHIDIALLMRHVRVLYVRHIRRLVYVVPSPPLCHNQPACKISSPSLREEPIFSHGVTIYQ